MPPHLRVARATHDLPALSRLYEEGLGLQRLGSFADHEGFDGVMLGAPSAGYHFEFTAERGAPPIGRPSGDDLLVFYVPEESEWNARCAAMERAGFRRVPSHNPYWDVRGRTFEDPEGYRVVIERAGWGS